MITSLLNPNRSVGLRVRLVSGAALVFLVALKPVLRANPEVPPASGSLLELDKNFSPAAVKTTAHLELAKRPDGTPALKAVFTPDATSGAFGTLTFPNPADGWNLTGFTGVRVEVTNNGAADELVRVRVDNAGDKGANFDANGVSIAAGETKTIQVEFGASFGQPAYKLDPANVTAVTLYITKPTTTATLLISSLRAYKAT